MAAIQLHPTRCAICGSEGHADELYPASLDLDTLTPRVFSAHRLPDLIHYRVVRCRTCGLVRSDPIADPELLAQLYGQSSFTYADQVESLRMTYSHYLAKLDEYGVQKGALLEVGCGNGFFLEEALMQGYTSVKGIEPSAAAIAAASPWLRPHIACDVMRPGILEPEQFDVVCMFQVFDHVADPGALLDECFTLLKPGGLMLCINHDVEAGTARLFRHHSPIIDIEHTYLYSPRTMARVLSAHDFHVKQIGSAVNWCTLASLAHLTPFPAWLKKALLPRLSGRFARKIRLPIPLGNLYLIAQRSSARVSHPPQADL